jgi:hypothetical protein
MTKSKSGGIQAASIRVARQAPLRMAPTESLEPTESRQGPPRRTRGRQAHDPLEMTRRDELVIEHLFSRTVCAAFDNGILCQRYLVPLELGRSVPGRESESSNVEEVAHQALAKFRTDATTPLKKPMKGPLAVSG